MPEPFVLLDDARPQDASNARLYRGPAEVVVARRGDEVLPALERMAELSAAGHHLAGYLAYEAGYAMEPRLEPLLTGRTGANGPLVWFGAFSGYETLDPSEVPGLLNGLASGPGTIGPLEPLVSVGTYATRFAELHEAIHAGDVYQANLSLPLAGSWRGDPVGLYAALRGSAGAGYGALIHDGSHWLLSFSPELMFALSEGRITARPMKGTRPRAADPGEDALLAAGLATSEKDRAENLMIVDLLRNDLSRVAEPGSVTVERPFAVETYPTVHQMTTDVRARLRDGLGAVDLLKNLFPCGSITGAPKIRAMELIARLERDPRGPYCGAIGRIDPAKPKGTGDAAFNVAIRTLHLTGGEGGAARAVLGVGSGVVADSEGLSEWRECLIKGGFVRQSSPVQLAADFDLIETMAFSLDEGIPLLELHLARIKASAEELGFTLDRHALRNAIQALCFEAVGPGKLRLMVSRSGAYSLEFSDLPPALVEPVSCAVLRLPLDQGDWRLRHKTSDRSFYEEGLAAARSAGAAEALFIRDDGLMTEGSFTNLFLERDGRLLTPPARLGLLPGVLRAALLEQGRAVEAELSLDDLEGGFLIGNSLRGLMPARLLP